MHVVIKRRLYILAIYLLTICILYKLFNVEVMSIVISVYNFIVGTLFLVSNKFYNWLTINPDKKRRIMIIVASYISIFPLIF